MSCLVAASQIGSYLGSPHGRPRLGLDQDLPHVGMPGPAFDLAGAVLRRLDRRADGSAPTLMPVVVAVQPVVVLPVVQRAAHRVVHLGEARRIGGGLEDGDVGAGLHDQLLERQIGVAARELAVGRERVHPHRVGVRVIGRVVVDLVADLARQEVLAAPRLRDVLRQHPALGHRMHVGVDAAHGDALRRGLPLCGCHRHRGLLDRQVSCHCALTPAPTSMPYSCAAFRQHSLSRCSSEYEAGTVSSLSLPVRVARPVHHHVVLAGEAEPLAGEFGVARTVHRALDEVGVAGQVVARHLRRPRRLFEVGTTEAVHPPHERRQHVGGSVGPHELQRGHPFEYPFDDHVHQVVEEIQRHEADVLLVGPRHTRAASARTTRPAPTSMCTATGRFASTAASHSGQYCGLPYSSRDCSGTPICTTRGWSAYLAISRSAPVMSSGFTRMVPRNRSA